jgi:PBSX family phage terminase large subunit
MSQLNTVEYEYLPKQGEFLQNCVDVPFSCYIGGFGSGKTHILATQGLILSATPSRGLIGAPTYRMLEDTTQRKFMDLAGPAGWIAGFSQRKNIATLVNGTEILFRSLDNPGRLAGLELDWFGVDEIGLVKKATWRMLVGRLRRGIRKGFGVGNPGELTHWSYDEFVINAAKHPELFRLVTATSFENTYLPPRYVEDMLASFGEDSPYAKRYVKGMFVSFEGAYWSNFENRPYSEGGHVIPAVQSPSSFPFKNTPRWGKVIDFGFEHPFACLWYVTDGEQMIFFDEYVMAHGLIKEHVLNIRMHEEAHQRMFGTHFIEPFAYTDHEAVSRAEIGAVQDESGRKIGFDCVPSEKKVMESILLVQSLFGMNRLFITSNCERTLREVSTYRPEIPKDIEKEGEHPQRVGEDCCSCVRYATWMEMNHLAPWHRPADMGYTTSEEGAGSNYFEEMQPAGENDAWPK